MAVTTLHGSSAVDVQRYGYAGGLRDTSGHLMHYGMRWYDPITGRFTQQDSLETLADPTRSNRYEYAASNPTNYIDPTGLERCWVSSMNGSYWCRSAPSGPTYDYGDVGCFALNAGLLFTGAKLLTTAYRTGSSVVSQSRRAFGAGLGLTLFSTVSC
ncbi:hypothetical protein DQ244_07345 [Blastococcus sp. TBT05-19]|nr:hypothetical protein DQ244_07345 [Blastococcus sp. TBT05-19]